MAGLGVLGNAHAGTLVQHRSRVRRDPSQPNLRQVHLIHAEVFDDARAMGYELGPGDLGENVLTADVDLLGLPTGTLLDLGGPVVRLTGLRNPCAQINAFRPGLLKVVLSRADGTPTDEPAPPTASPESATASVMRKAGVMAVVERGGEVFPGQPITVILPKTPHTPLAPVEVAGPLQEGTISGYLLTIPTAAPGAPKPIGSLPCHWSRLKNRSTSASLGVSKSFGLGFGSA